MSEDIVRSGVTEVLEAVNVLDDFNTAMKETSIGTGICARCAFSGLMFALSDSDFHDSESRDRNCWNCPRAGSKLCLECTADQGQWNEH